MNFFVNKRGVTLLEMLMVLVIVSMLSIVAIPIYQNITVTIVKSSIRKQLESTFNNASMVAKTKLRKVNIEAYDNTIKLVLLKKEGVEWIEDAPIEEVTLDERFMFNEAKTLVYNVRGFPENTDTFNLISEDATISLQVDVFVDGRLEIVVT